MHPHQTWNFDLLAGTGIIDKVSPCQATLVDPYIRQLSKSPFFQLERQADEWGCGCWHERDGWCSQWHSSIVCNNITFGWTRQVCTYSIQEGLDGCVLDRRAEEYRGESASDGCSSNCVGYMFIRGCFLIDDHIAHLVVYFCQLLNKFRAFLLGELQYRCRYLVGLDDLDTIETLITGSSEYNLNYSPFLALVVNSFPSYEVYDTFQFIFYSNGHLHRSSRHPKFSTDLFYYPPWIGTGSDPYLNFMSGKTVGLHTCPFY